MAITKKLIITKAQVIKAIREEPLTPQVFVGYPIRDGQKCSVCAVGAVMRQSIPLIKKDKLEWVCRQATGDGEVSSTTPERVASMLREKHYLNALSATFEDQCEEAGFYCGTLITKNQPIRERLVTWVKKNFPTRFSITVML